MRGYGQFCPVSQALEVLGERWTLIVVRELLCGSTRFNEILRGAPLMSRTLLSQRLKGLTDAGVIERREGPSGPEYHLTEAGLELRPLVDGLGVWGQRWARQGVDREHLDPTLLMWDLQRNIAVEELPPERVVVRFWYRDQPAKKARYWLRLERPEVDLCLINPGYEVTLEVETRLKVMIEAWMGDCDLDEAVRSGSIQVKGPSKLVQAFPRWLRRSLFAPVERPTAGGTGA